MKPMDQKQFARDLRQFPNNYEELLWQLLRNRRRCNKKFRRLHPIGIYTVLKSIALKKDPTSKSMDAFTSPSKADYTMKPVIGLCTRTVYVYYVLLASK
jgi:hypothetical protein